MTKKEKEELDRLKKEYNNQEKKANIKLRELNKIKKELLKELDYQEVIDSKVYKKKNMEYIKEKRISKGYSVKQLSELADLPVSVIEKAEKGSVNIRFEEYIIIFVVLEIIKPDFFL